MRKWTIGGVALALAMATSPAHADYVYDPADLPEDFECNDDWDERPCADQRLGEAWSEKYGRAYNYWFDEILFNTNIYFAKKGEVLLATSEANEEISEPDYESLGRETRNLVDVTYSKALRRYDGWAFAINEKAQLRMVRMRAEDEIDPQAMKKFKDILPTTLAETAPLVTFTAAWEDADLTKCDGAIEHLLNFPAQKGGQFWSEKELEWMPDYEPRERDGTFIVTADGDSVILRARSVEDAGAPTVRLQSPGYAIYDQSNRGLGYDWAMEMDEIVRPCLKPSEAVPPWEKVLAANPSEPPTKP